MNNRKVRGATCKEFNGVKFRSGLELSFYKKLLESGLDFSYESEKVLLWEGFKPSRVKVFCPDKIGTGRYGKTLEDQSHRKVLNITYTPDFIVRKGNNVIYVEIKGNPNDTYPRTKKMFLRHLEERDDGFNYIFIEPHNIRQMEQCLEIINNYE